jgi:hypothetical protein
MSATGDERTPTIDAVGDGELLERAGAAERERVRAALAVERLER